LYSSRPLQPNMPRTLSPAVLPIGQMLPGWSKAATLMLFFCLLIPRGVELQLGSIMIDTSRLVLTGLTIYALNQLFSGIVVLRATPADWLISCNVGIIVLSAIYHKGLGGLEDAIANTIDMGMAYFVARFYIRDRVCYYYFIRIALIIAVISTASALVETVTGFSVIRALWHTLFPKVELVRLFEQRHGFFRAQAAFREHILFGLYCAMDFALAVLIAPQYLGMKKNTYRICLAMCFLGVLSSMSSGPWIAMGLCIVCLLYAWIMKDVQGRWKILIGTVVVVFIMLSFFSNRGPVVLAIDYLTLDPATGHFRLDMWEAVTAILRDHWLIGWGWGADWPRAEWYLTSSIDSFYAVWFVRSGVFSVLALLGFISYSWFKIGAISGWKSPVARQALGWLIATICLFVTALTVDFFSTMIFAVFFTLGAGQMLVGIANQYTGAKQGIGNTRTKYTGERRVMQSS
jgi:hypothetical protein